MRVIQIKYKLLLAYLLIAFIFVQAVSGLLHMDWHLSSQEPAGTHHHYPVSSMLTDHVLVEPDKGIVELDLQLKSIFGNTLLPLFLLFTLALLLITRNAIRLPYTELFLYPSQYLRSRIHPARAPPF